ncbi:MAG: LCP family protein [Clostridiales bacterium]|nr:LCP family protein [Clostridiales bacterium]
MRRNFFGSRKTLHFTTEQNAKKNKNKIFILSLLIFVFVFGGITSLVLLIKYDFNINAIIGKPEETTILNTQPEDVEAPLPEISGKANFLVVGFDDDFKEFRFISIVNIDKDNVTFNVCSIDPNVQATVNGRAGTFLSHYEYGGFNQLVMAVENHLGFKLDRYVAFTDTGMKDFIKAIGDALAINLENPIEYRTEKWNLSLPAGNQAISGDTIMKYMQMPESDMNSMLLKQSGLICKMLDQYVVYKNVVEGDDLFVKLINTVRSNISIADFNSYSDCLQVFVKSKERKPSTAVTSTDGFNESVS